jgi:TonB family protein
MNTLLIYMAKAAFYMAAFYLVYYLMLSKDTFYSRNRAFILFSILAALILPFITIQTNQQVTIPVFGKALSEIIIYGSRNGADIPNAHETSISTLKAFWFVYLTGICLFSVKLFIDFCELTVLIVRKKTRNSHIVYFQGLNTSGFSALGHVFINTRLTPEESEEIIKHEQNHLDHHHFLDIIFIEVISVLQWFNPFVHMFSRSLRAVHEFQADEGCLKTGIPVCSYQSLLMNQVFKSNIFTITNCFSNPTLIKKRMLMMTKKKSGALANIKLLLALPAVTAVLLAFSEGVEVQATKMVPSETIASAPVLYNPDESIIASLSGAKRNIEIELPPPLPSHVRSTQEGKIETVIEEIVTESQSGSSSEIIANEEAPTEVFVVVEEMPHYPGGDTEMMKFIYENIKYPEIAKTNNIQGRVILRFCVTYKGKIDQISILKGIDPSLDAEAMRVVGILPQWTPGKQGGKPVNVWYSLPINFQLKQ